MTNDEVTLTLHVKVDASELEAAAARWDLRERMRLAEMDLKEAFALVGALEDRVKALEDQRINEKPLFELCGYGSAAEMVAGQQAHLKKIREEFVERRAKLEDGS